jgi:hypothetical protein
VNARKRTGGDRTHPDFRTQRAVLSSFTNEGADVYFFLMDRCWNAGDPDSPFTDFTPTHIRFPPGKRKKYNLHQSQVVDDIEAGGDDSRDAELDE